MKKIDFVNVALCIYIIGVMAYLVLGAVSDREVKIECIRKGGSIVKVSGDVACQAPQVKP